MPAAAVIFGCEGPTLTSSERKFFARADPLGFILFARNCSNPHQVRDLVEEMRASVGRADAPVLIDQEGGRVARLAPPHWRKAPAAARFGALAAADAGLARAATYDNARLLAAELASLGITVDCAPVLDLPAPGADPIIGERAFGTDPSLVAALGRAFCEGLMAGGVLPVVKHVPGHGRAAVDSHLALPVVSASRTELEATDFRPFAALNDAPWAMTAHVVYSAIDPDRPATTSATVIAEAIRGFIGFDGFLVSDDLSMRALRGDFGRRTSEALAAGCDAVLHCNGKRAEMEAVAEAASPLSPEAQARLAAAAARLGTPTELDVPAVTARLDSLLAQAKASA